MAKAPGAREAHSRKIRAALISACGELLGQKPIDAITINNIVETAAVAKGSFYNHFPDKESLAMTVSTAIREEVEQKVIESNRNVTDPAYRIARGVCNHIKLAVDNPQKATVMLRSPKLATSSEYSLNRNIQIDILEGVASGRFAARCEEAGIIQVMGVTISTMLRVVEQELSVEQAVDLSTKVFALTLCGFGVNEEEAIRIVSDSARDIIGS